MKSFRYLGSVITTNRESAEDIKCRINGHNGVHLISIEILRSDYLMSELKQSFYTVEKRETHRQEN